jgi:uncharacterized protein YjbI with pentapeptide repeats
MNATVNVPPKWRESVKLNLAGFDGDGPKNSRFLGAEFTDANLEGARINIKFLNFVYLYLCRTVTPDGTISDGDCKFVQSLVQGRT